MDTDTKILIVFMFLCVWGITFLLLFQMEYQNLAMSLHPEIFMEYNWRTLPQLIRYDLEIEIYPMVPIVSVMFTGAIATLFFFAFVYVVDWLIMRR